MAGKAYLQKKLAPRGSPGGGAGGQVLGGASKGELGSEVEPMPGSQYRDDPKSGTARDLDLSLAIPIIGIVVAIGALAVLYARN